MASYLFKMYARQTLLKHTTADSVTLKWSPFPLSIFSDKSLCTPYSTYLEYRFHTTMLYSTILPLSGINPGVCCYCLLLCVINISFLLYNYYLLETIMDFYNETKVQIQHFSRPHLSKTYIQPKTYNTHKNQNHTNFNCPRSIFHMP